MKLLFSITMVLAAAQADVTIDLAKAVFDEDLGQFCVMQKVHTTYAYVLSEKEMQNKVP